jgi:hypothetical protein
VNLREEEEDEEDSQDNEAQDEPAGPAIPGAAAVCASVVPVGIVIAAGYGVSCVSEVCATGASKARVAKTWSYILAVLSREENHDVLVVCECWRCLSRWNASQCCSRRRRIGSQMVLREREEQGGDPRMQSDCWQAYEQSSATAAIAFICNVPELMTTA